MSQFDFIYKMQVKKIIFSILMLFIFNSSYSQLSGTYLIGAAQPEPFNTISNAVNHLNNVGIIGNELVYFLLIDTLYEESGICVKHCPGENATSYVVLKPATGVNAKIRGSNVFDGFGEYFFRITAMDFIIDGSNNGTNTRNLTFESTLSFLNKGYHSNILIGSLEDMPNGYIIHQVDIRNCNIISNKRAAAIDVRATACTLFSENIYISNCTKGYEIFEYGLNGGTVSISENKIDNIASNGIELNTRGDVYLMDNSISANVCGVYLNLETNVLYNTILIGNNYVFNANTYGIYLSKIQASDCLIENNRIYDIIGNPTIPVCAGIRIDNAGVRLQNNMIFHIAGGILNTGLYISNINSPAQFYHNSVYITQDIQNGLSAATNSYSAALYINSANSNIDFRNNILWTALGEKENSEILSGGYAFFNAEGQPFEKFNNNIYFSSNHDTDYLAFSNGQNYSTIAQWISDYPTQNLQSEFINPSFISELDLDILNSNDIGSSLNILTDIHGETRNVDAPDAGADEFNNLIEFTFSKVCLGEKVIFQIYNLINIQSALWAFGDGQTSTEFNPNHSYVSSGIYNVSLTVTYTGGQQQTVNRQVVISQKPIISTITHN